MSRNTPHFEGKEALEHVAEKLAHGKIDSSEIHGTELPGYLSAATDAARDTAVFLLLTGSLFLMSLENKQNFFTNFIILSLGWAIWKFGRSAWLSWFRLERLHRLVRQEKWEIENNRDQERQELKELYHAKGFDGKLLDQVVEVLMADGDRLLKVMVEEELGLKLESQDHPLKQATGALCGVLFSASIIFLFFWIYPAFGILIGSILSIALASLYSAYYIQNKITPAVVWNVGIAILGFATVYFIHSFIFAN